MQSKLFWLFYQDKISYNFTVKLNTNRNVVQLARMCASGAQGWRFESAHSDNLRCNISSCANL